VIQVAVYSEINTKLINKEWAERAVVGYKRMVHHVTSRLAPVFNPAIYSSTESVNNYY